MKGPILSVALRMLIAWARRRPAAPLVIHSAPPPMREERMGPPSDLLDVKDAPHPPPPPLEVKVEHLHGTESQANSEERARLIELRASLGSLAYEMIKQFQDGLAPHETNLGLQVLCEISSFLTGNFDGVAALGGTSGEFRAELMVAWIQQGRASALETHRQNCHGCRWEKVVESHINPN